MLFSFVGASLNLYGATAVVMQSLNLKHQPSAQWRGAFIFTDKFFSRWGSFLGSCDYDDFICTVLYLYLFQVGRISNQLICVFLACSDGRRVVVMDMRLFFT